MSTQSCKVIAKEQQGFNVPRSTINPKLHPIHLMIYKNHFGIFINP